MNFKLSILKCFTFTILIFLIHNGILLSIRYFKIEGTSLDYRFVSSLSYISLFIIYVAVIIFLKKKEKLILIPKNKINIKLFWKTIILVILIAIFFEIVMDSIRNINIIVDHNNTNFNSIHYNNFDLKILWITFVSVIIRNPYHLIEVMISLFLGPFVQEILFRRYFFIGLLNRYNIKIAFLISSMLFVGIHYNSIIEHPIRIIIYFGYSLISAYIFYVTLNIWLSILLHMILNFLHQCYTIFIYQYLELVAYHKFGIYYWIVILFSAILFVYLLYLIKKLVIKYRTSALNLV